MSWCALSSRNCQKVAPVSSSSASVSESTLATAGSALLQHMPLRRATRGVQACAPGGGEMEGRRVGGRDEGMKGGGVGLTCMFDGCTSRARTAMLGHARHPGAAQARAPNCQSHPTRCPPVITRLELHTTASCRIAGLFPHSQAERQRPPGNARQPGDAPAPLASRQAEHVLKSPCDCTACTHWCRPRSAAPAWRVARKQGAECN